MTISSSESNSNTQDYREGRRRSKAAPHEAHTKQLQGMRLHIQAKPNASYLRPTQANISAAPYKQVQHRDRNTHPPQAGLTHL
jgi:hypothetical protein